MYTTTRTNDPVPARRSLHARLMTMLATLLVVVGVGVGTASAAQAATIARAYVCFDSSATASGYSMTEGAYWFDGTRWVFQSSITLSNTGGCVTWNLGRAGIWAFSVASANKIYGATEYHSGTSTAKQVNSGTYVDFGHTRVTVSYGPYYS